MYIGYWTLNKYYYLVDMFGREAITSQISSDVADIRLLSFTDVKGSISTSMFASSYL